MTTKAVANVYNNLISEAGYGMSELLNKSFSVFTDDENYMREGATYNPGYLIYSSANLKEANASFSPLGNKSQINIGISGVKFYKTKTKTYTGGKLPEALIHSGNAISILYAHEYLGHAEGGGGENRSEYNAYSIQKKHPSFKNVTPDYKQHVENKLKANKQN